jgi:hypothetical protein
LAEFVQDCPRCSAKSITFDVLGDSPTGYTNKMWKFELLSRCRSCEWCSIAVFSTRSPINGTYQSGGLTSSNGAINYLDFLKFVSIADNVSIDVPEHLPDNVLNCYNEGAASFNIGAYNAAASMFRLALDLATKGLLPDLSAEDGGPNSAQRKRLYDRLNYLFEKRLIAPELAELADCVREDGNDGAHDGTLGKADAEDLTDFTQQLLERVFSEPARLRIAKARREARRAEG